jgi:hypothetical protein
MSGCGPRTLVLSSLLALAGAAACMLVATPAALAHSGKAHAKANAARGLVFRGLDHGPKGGSCKGVYTLHKGNGKIGCTHGPDPAPKGRDVRRRRSTLELRRAAAETASPSTPSATAGIECVGDGVSGNRVLTVYAYPATGVDRYADIAPLIRGWAADVDGEVDASAAETGGTRHVRYVTDSGCELVVEKVSLSGGALGSFSTMESELLSKGYNRDDRKYLVWVDWNEYCGIADLWLDDSALASNLNNGRTGVGPMFARVDNGCWGYAEKHELVHNLGGVQNSAPNSSGYGHCTDESDDMCYVDAPGVVMRQICPAEHERLLDCNHDDYFHTDPVAGSYLATHWNTASSSFLTEGGADTAAPEVSAPVVRFGGTAGKSLLPVTVSWSAADDSSGIASSELAQSVDGGLYTDLTLASATATSIGRSLTPGHTYAYRAGAVDGVGNVSSAESTGFVPSVRQESLRTISYAGTWKRTAASYAMGGYMKYATARGARASTSFSGRAFAWVSRLGPGCGRAYVYVDGMYATSVNLYSSLSRPRRIVFSRSWENAGAHSVFVWVTGTAGHPRVDLDAFLVVR